MFYILASYIYYVLEIFYELYRYIYISTILHLYTFLINIFLFSGGGGGVIEIVEKCIRSKENVDFPHKFPSQ